MSLLRSSLIMLSVLFAATGGVYAQTADPRDLSVQQQTVSAVTSNNSKLRVTAWVDHENNRYDLGEEINLSVRVAQDAFITIIAVGPSGNAVLLYPNAFQPSVKVRGGSTVQIPGKDAEARIVATAPAGNELIRVIASSDPIDVIDPGVLVGSGAFRSIDGGSDRVARDLALAVQQEPEIAFYDKVIKTRARGDVELDMDDGVEGEQEDVAAALPPLIATDAAEYAVGDTVQLAVTAMEECNLWVVNVSSDESVHLLFPNQKVRENAIPSGDTVLISGGDAPVRVMAAGPAGKETIYALCGPKETTPWEDGIDFTQMFPAVGEKTPLGRALVALDAAEDETVIPEVYSWSMVSLTVTD